MSDAVLVETDGPVTIVTINRPHARNAVDRETAGILYDAFLAFDADESQYAAVLTGAEGTFCAAFRELGFGIAIKCDDGHGRAAEVILGALIEAFVAPEAGLSMRAVKNRRGRIVGEVRVVADLIAALRSAART